MLRIVTSILNRLNNLIRNSTTTFDLLNMRHEIIRGDLLILFLSFSEIFIRAFQLFIFDSAEINLIAEQFLRLPRSGIRGSGDGDQMNINSNSVIELNQRLQGMASSTLHAQYLLQANGNVKFVFLRLSAEVIANLMHSLERITALEFQYRHLHLMSSAVVSSPMPASSLNWRDERTVTILPNPFSQENIESGMPSSANASAGSFATSQTPSSVPSNNENSWSRSSVSQRTNANASDRSSSAGNDRQFPSLNSSNGSAFAVLRRRNDDRRNPNTHRLSIEVSNLNSNINLNRNAFRLRNWQNRLMRQVRMHSPVRRSFSNFSSPATVDPNTAHRAVSDNPRPSVSASSDELSDFNVFNSENPDLSGGEARSDSDLSIYVNSAADTSGSSSTSDPFNNSTAQSDLFNPDLDYGEGSDQAEGDAATPDVSYFYC